MAVSQPLQGAGAVSAPLQEVSQASVRQECRIEEKESGGEGQKGQQEGGMVHTEERGPSGSKKRLRVGSANKGGGDAKQRRTVGGGRRDSGSVGNDGPTATHRLKVAF